jgi:deazaflavin-dependent oxidoreductase (nitroreductase family)
MWFMNHIFNPIVRWVLTSPLHTIMSKSVLLISFHGKKSGKEYITPVQYACDEKKIWIMVGLAGKKHWWHNLIGGAQVRVCIQREWLNGQASVLRGEANRQEITAGLKAMIKAFPSFGKQYGDLESPALDIESIVFVKIELN